MPSCRFAYTVELAAARGSGQDRARVFERGDDLLIALADGAGGTAHGAIAAQTIVDTVAAAPTANDWSALLADLDDKLLGCGQSTAVILSLTRIIAGQYRYRPRGSISTG